MSALNTPSAPAAAASKASASTSTAFKPSAPASKPSAPAADAAPAPMPKADAPPQALEAWRVATSTRLATEAKRAIGFSLSHHVLLNSPSLARLGLRSVADVCVAALARARAAYLPSREDYDTKRLLLLTPHASLAAELARLPLAGCLVLSTAQAAALLDTPTAAAAAAAPAAGGSGGGGDSGGGSESRSRKREAVRAERAATPPARLPRHAFLLRSAAHPERGAFAVPCVVVVDLTCRIEALGGGGGGGALAALEALQRLLGSSGGGEAPLQLLTRVGYEREEREGRTAAVFLSADEQLGGRGDTDAHVMGLVPTDAAGCPEQFEVVERA